MLRRIALPVAIALTLLCSGLPATAQTIPVVPPGATEFSIPYATGVMVQGPSSSLVYLLIKTDVDFDQEQTDNPQRLAMTQERLAYEQALRDTLHQPVSLLLLVGKNSEDSQYPYVVSPACSLAVVRGNQTFPALGLLYPLALTPGQTGYTYVVFPKMEFCEDDRLVVVYKP